MTIEPIIRVKMNKYAQDTNVNGVTEDQLFERFVNFNILSMHQPYVLTTDNELLDDICIGGSNDMGIDGIAISLNGKFINSTSDIDDILNDGKKGKFEFIFLQSKNKEKFELGEYAKFISGVKDFLNESIKQPFNKDVERWHNIRDYIFSDDIMVKWDDNPNIRMYYVVMGKWENTPHILAYSDEMKDQLEKTRCYKDINFHYIDSQAFNDILKNNENCYTAVINFIDSMSMNEVEEVDNSCVILCKATDLVNMLRTNENLIRKTLFEDNVRDYQGETSINSEMEQTLKENCERFMLLNNGITIVCDEAQMGNRKITVKNPQIVNGCQTCNVLFKSFIDGVNVENASVIVKIISTKSSKIANMIVKGTNRQNIVFDEAFEITRDFHKLLEEFFASMKCKPYDHIYYERRSKQYFDNPLVKPYQRVTFKILIQSIVSLFLYKTHEGHRHESKLLETYKNQIFVDNQSFYPYFTASYLYMKMESLFRMKKIPSNKYPYKMQIMLLTKELISGESPNLNSKKEIDKYCKRILQNIDDDTSIQSFAYKACELFDEIVAQWIEFKGKSYYYAIKDSAEFTQFMLSKVRNDPKVYATEQKTELTTHKVFRGKIMTPKRDKHGRYFGFITRFPDNIFFHQEDNGQIVDWEDIKGKDVTYTMLDGIKGPRAANVTILDEDNNEDVEAAEI